MTRYCCLLLVLLLLGCSKKEEALDFVPGQVAIGTQDATTIPQLFTLANARGLSVVYVFPARYSSTLPSDSLDYLRRQLATKAYANAPDWPVQIAHNVQTNTVQLTIRLVDMTVPNQQDWLTTVQDLRLQELPGGKSALLQVPIGEEKRWVAEL
ncbi:hypothetical protein DNI29_03365 [Hymenobacter sediminis]|uniref:hypothetical protein n=1 Tax=Hymenobacter sediminis TaxID=2218621 RepID=UPI000F4E520E|nr:hypothetical protein [Hymenobacter sediminis]RPD49849.1 hypothetical protein DNI29_03365 [Hymenobacter sediminis]